MTASPFTAPASVLTVMAHPDDAELWAGGTLARCSASGAAVTIAIPHHSEPVRDAEAAAGAAILGAKLYQYDQSTVTALRELLLAVRPEIVITHPLRDVHPDHRSLAETLVAALPDVFIAIGYPRRVYTADTYNKPHRRRPRTRTHHHGHHRHLRDQEARARGLHIAADQRPFRSHGRDPCPAMGLPNRRALRGELRTGAHPRSPPGGVDIVTRLRSRGSVQPL